jgi:hypothetical protein
MSKRERDNSEDVPADEATKAQKPKKAFEVNITIWDDGEISSKLVEFVKKERGAPEKWMRKPDQFNAAIKDKISENPVLLLEKLAESLNINLSALLAAKPKVTDSGK